jgi:hypothetical protein
MGSKHRRQDRGDGPLNRLFAMVAAAVAFAAVVSAAVVFVVGASSPHRQNTPDAVSPPEQISQQGTLVAVSADSVTARSSNGFARTYLVNANTTAITDTGSRIGSASSAFAVNDEVSIFAVVQGGTAIATAVAHRELAHLGGPPMDTVALP